MVLSTWKTIPSGVSKVADKRALCPFFQNRLKVERWLGAMERIATLPKARRPGRRGWSCTAGRGIKRT